MNDHRHGIDIIQARNMATQESRMELQFDAVAPQLLLSVTPHQFATLTTAEIQAAHLGFIPASLAEYCVATYKFAVNSGGRAEIYSNFDQEKSVVLAMPNHSVDFFVRQTTLIVCDDCERRKSA